MRMKIVMTLLFALVACGLAGYSTASSAQATEKVNAAPKVIMYATRTCTYCVKARAWFILNHVEWDERDVETSAEANKEWRQLGGMGTPLILINGKAIHGFDEARIKVELDSLDS